MFEHQRIHTQTHIQWQHSIRSRRVWLCIIMHMSGLTSAEHLCTKYGIRNWSVCVSSSMVRLFDYIVWWYYTYLNKIMRLNVITDTIIWARCNQHKWPRITAGIMERNWNMVSFVATASATENSPTFACAVCWTEMCAVYAMISINEHICFASMQCVSLALFASYFIEFARLLIPLGSHWFGFDIRSRELHDFSRVWKILLAANALTIPGENKGKTFFSTNCFSWVQLRDGSRHTKSHFSTAIKMRYKFPSTTVGSLWNST